MNQYNTSLKLLYESSGSSSLLADALGVTDAILQKAIKSVTASTPGDPDYIPKLNLALQNAKAYSRGATGIEREDIADQANLFLKKYKYQISETLHKVYKDRIGVNLNKSAIGEFNDLKVNFFEAITKLDTDISLGNITENFITVNNMRLLYESDDDITQTSYYSLDLLEMYRRIENSVKTLDFTTFFIDNQVAEDIANSQRKSETSLSSTLKRHFGISNIKDLKYFSSDDSAFQKADDFYNPIFEFINSFIKDSLPLAYITAIYSNRRYFKEHGIEIANNGADRFISDLTVDTIGSMEGEKLPWGDSLVRQFGNNTDKLNEVFNNAITDTTIKYLQTSNSPLYDSMTKIVDAEYNKFKNEFTRKKNTLSKKSEAEIEYHRERAKNIVINAKEAADVKKSYYVEQLGLLKARNGQAQAVDQEKFEKVKSAIKKISFLGAVGGGIYSLSPGTGVLGKNLVQGSILNILAEIGIDGTIGEIASIVLGVPGTYFACKLAAKGVALGVNKLLERVKFARKWTGASGKEKYGQSGVDKSGKVELDNLKPGSSSKDIVDFSVKEDASLEETYNLIAEAIANDYNKKIQDARDEQNNYVKLNIKDESIRVLEQLNKLDEKIDELEIMYANRFRLVKQKLVVDSNFIALRDSIIATTLSATKIAKRVVTSESYKALLSENESAAVDASFIREELTSSGITDVSKELEQATAYILNSLFDIKVEGIELVDFNKLSVQKVVEAKKERAKEIEPGEPAMKSIPKPKKALKLEDPVTPENVLSIANLSGGENFTSLLEELSQNRELQQVFEKIIEGEKLTFKELVEQVSESSDNLSGFEKAIVQGLDTFKSNLPPIPLEFAKQIIKDEIGRDKTRIIDIKDSENRPENLAYKSVYEEKDIKPRVVLLSQFFKINRDKELDSDIVKYIEPKLNYFISSILKDEGKDDAYDNLNYKYLDEVSRAMMRLYSNSLQESSRDTFRRRNTSIIAERRLQLEADIHNVLYKTWKC